MQNQQWYEWQGAAVNIDEALVVWPPLTFCCVDQFLIGHGPKLVCSPGIGDPYSR